MALARFGAEPVIRALPPPGRRTLERLLDRQSAISDAFSTATNKLSHQRGILQRAQSRLAEVERKSPLDREFARAPLAPGAAYLAPGPKRDAAILANKERYIAPLREEHDEAQSEIGRLTEHMAALKAKTSGLPARCIRYGLDQLDLTKPIEPFSGSLPKIPKGQPRQIVEDLRRQIVDLRSRREQIALAPLPAARGAD